MFVGLFTIKPITAKAAGAITATVEQTGTLSAPVYILNVTNVAEPIVGYESLIISWPEQLEPNWGALLTTYTYLQKNEAAGASSATFTVSAPIGTNGTAANIKSFLNQISFAPKVAGVFPASTAKINISVYENHGVLWENHPDGDIHFYEFVPTPVTTLSWSDAYNAAQASTVTTVGGVTHGYLATVTSIEEQTYIYNAIGQLPGWLGGTRATIGGNKIDNESSITEAALQVSDGVIEWYWACGPEAGLVFHNMRDSREQGIGPGSITRTNKNADIFARMEAQFPDYIVDSAEGTKSAVFSYFDKSLTTDLFGVINNLEGVPYAPASQGEPTGSGHTEAFLQWARLYTPYWNDLSNVYGDGTPNPQYMLGYYIEYSIPQSAFAAQLELPLPAVPIFVKFDKNDGAPNIIDTQSFWSSDTPRTVTLPAVGTYAGHDTDGKWYTAAAKGSGTEVTTATVFNASATVYVQWEIQHFTVIFHSKTSQVYPNVPLDYDDLVTAPSAPTLPPGVTDFLGWTLQDGTSYTFGSAVQDAADASSRELHLYASYNPSVFTVIFDDNYPGGSIDSTRTGFISDSVAAKPSPTRPGYRFAGWYEDAQGTIPATIPTTFAGNAYFYAKWIRNSSDGGSWDTEPPVIAVTPPKTGGAASGVWALLLAFAALAWARARRNTMA
jgi:uncharacterized repeat protein (TIGR02543 family)